ncbi:hypothetical protein RUND412_008930 [Rhizina undulata]
MSSQNVTDLTSEILIGILSACHNRRDLKNLCHSDPAFMEAYRLVPTAISKAIFLKQLEEMGIPCSPERVFNMARKIFMLTGRHAQESYSQDILITTLPHERFHDLEPIFEIFCEEKEKMEETYSFSFYLSIFNSHPNKLIQLTKDKLKGVFIYFSLIFRLYTLEAAYYEAVVRENRRSSVMAGIVHPSMNFLDEYTYREMVLIFWCSLQSSMKLDFATGLLLRDELEQKRVTEGIELNDEDREILSFPEWLDQEANSNGQVAQ